MYEVDGVIWAFELFIKGISKRVIHVISTKTVNRLF
jgi:hypothetical protein